MATFTPKSQQQIDEERLLPKGEYPFKVIECEEKQGPQCIYFRLKFELTINNVRITWYDQLVLHDAWIGRLRHACEEMGILEAYESGNLDEGDFVGKVGILIMDHRRDKNGKMESFVKDYGARTEDKKIKNSSQPTLNKFGQPPIDYNVYEALTQKNQGTAKFDDDIPF